MECWHNLLDQVKENIMADKKETKAKATKKAKAEPKEAPNCKGCLDYRDIAGGLCANRKEKKAPAPGTAVLQGAAYIKPDPANCGRKRTE